MHRLYLVRHGIAVPHGTRGVAEDERPLTEKGERRMNQIGRGLRALGLKVDRIVTSPLPRASRTAEIVADCLGMSCVLERSDILRPDRDAASIGEWALNQPELRMMLVGHNPNISELVGWLIDGEAGRNACEMRKGGVASLGRGTNGAMVLDWLAPPRLFRKLAE
jgi:phosphohistidine phosphatase